jgi:F0F1-type ATP synthase assembly protein I
VVRVDEREQRELWNGFGNALSRAIELVVTPLLFALGGYGLDRWLGTSPLFVIVLATLAFVGLAVKSYYVYREDMLAHEARLPGHAGRAA